MTLANGQSNFRRYWSVEHMGNHCIDVLCVDCGRSWCVRCHDVYSTGSTQEAQDAQKKFAEKSRMISGDVCSCGSRRVIMD